AEVKGELGVKDLNLDATINAPGLDNALPGLGGTAKGLVKVRGTVSLSRLTCCSLPLASRVMVAGGISSPFTAVRKMTDYTLSMRTAVKGLEIP
ncbi:hypothetical protein ACUOCP_50755, partial [Escherichia sp. R-CC3]